MFEQNLGEINSEYNINVRYKYLSYFVVGYDRLLIQQTVCKLSSSYQIGKGITVTVRKHSTDFYSVSSH